MDFEFGGFMRHNYRIFLVEDDPVIARVVQNHLEGWGYVTQCATDFSDVLTQFRAQASAENATVIIAKMAADVTRKKGRRRRFNRIPFLCVTHCNDLLLEFLAELW